MSAKFPRQVLPLLMLYLDGGREIIGRTRLQKLLFLAEHEIPELKDYFSEKYSWEPYHYGPFSDNLLEDLIWLESWGFIEIVGTSLDDEESFSTVYKISEKGKRIIEEKVLQNLPEGLLRKLENLKKRYNYLDLHELIREVYEKYPEYTIRSKIRELIFGTG